MLPIVEHLRVDPSAEELTAVDRLAQALQIENPQLKLPDAFAELAARHIGEGATLYIDDLSEIPFLDRGQDSRFYQDRARLRAGNNDLVASCADEVEGYEEYCRGFLGLGSPQWLRPQTPPSPLRIANACWEDAGVRLALIDRLNRNELQYIHPNMGLLSIWELAFLLTRETGKAVPVIAPPPEVTRWVNDKIAFAAAVARLFGSAFIPRTECACNLAALARRVKEMSQHCRTLGFKRPNSAGGDGNLVVDAAQYLGRSLTEIRHMLGEQLKTLRWEGYSELLIDVWETDVLCSPSAQVWIPPEEQGLPVVEGLFVQTVQGARGEFVGAAPAEFGSELVQDISNRTWLLARLFQRLGYVGRCSFDMILVGAGLDDCRLEFIECNGRWGGTSLPMTLMNRIFGDWMRRPFAVHIARGIAGLEKASFVDLLKHFGSELFDARAGRGDLILFTPGRLHYRAGIAMIVLGDTWEEASRKAKGMPDRLRQFALAAVERS